MTPPLHCRFPDCLSLLLILCGVTAAEAAEFPKDFAAFQAELSPAISQKLDATPKHYRQIEPSLYYLCMAHADRLATLPDDERLETIVKLAEFIDRKRDETGELVVIGADRTMIGLLDPARGLEPKEITTIAAGYGAKPTVFKQDTATQSIRQVADEFLTTVSQAAASGTPTSVVVLGHGSPEEIQSYSIPFARLADTLIDGAGTTAGKPVDLAHLVLICDDCYSADFLTNLGTTIEQRCRDRSLTLRSLPIMIAGTNRDRVGHADFGEKFVPHFWKDVIELFYVRRPRPDAVTLRDFFDKVDNMMYGYGRAPIVQGAQVTGYRLVDPTLCQDPVFFVPLSDDDLASLRTILGLPADAPLPRFLDIG
jgi:nucleotide-binding universal stress UspA family protein